MGSLKKYQTWVLVGVAVIGVYAIIYADVVSRARESYQEAEKYMEWHRNPDKKISFYNQNFEKEKNKLDGLLGKKKISEEKYKEELDSLGFQRDFHISESSLKYAYQWYKDTYELFSPPQSKWVKQAREKAPATLELWKEELRAQKIPFEDTMFE